MTGIVFQQQLLMHLNEGLLQHGGTEYDRDVFLSIMNTPMGPQPSATLLVSTKNPLLGEPPLIAANIVPLGISKQEVLDAAKAMVDHLVKQRAELMSEDKAPSGGLVLP